MRIRSIKPEFWKSESMSSLDAFSRLTAIALLNASDDYGYFPANPTILRGDIFPFEDVEKVSRALAKLSEIGYIKVGEVKNSQQRKKIGKVVNFHLHQKVDHPSKRAYTDDSIVWESDSRESLASPRESLDQEQGAGSREQGEEGRRYQGVQGQQRGREQVAAIYGRHPAQARPKIPGATHISESLEDIIK